MPVVNREQTGSRLLKRFVSRLPGGKTPVGGEIGCAAGLLMWYGFFCVWHK